MLRADVVVEIIFNMEESDKTTIKTNAKPEAVSEILGAWLVAQTGKGWDSRESIRRGEYKISIKLDLSNDTFYTSSDTGNSSLTCGIVANVLQNLAKFQISPLG
jgi:hypothetical protein